MNQDNLIGKQLDEYRLENLLGQGGMARVYRGRDLMLERTVAIKVLREDYSIDPSFRERFRQDLPWQRVPDRGQSRRGERPGRDAAALPGTNPAEERLAGIQDHLLGTRGPGRHLPEPGCSR